jgi:hypothetical protein
VHLAVGHWGSSGVSKHLQPQVAPARLLPGSGTFTPSDNVSWSPAPIPGRGGHRGMRGELHSFIVTLSWLLSLYVGSSQDARSPRPELQLTLRGGRLAGFTALSSAGPGLAARWLGW